MPAVETGDDGPAPRREGRRRVLFAGVGTAGMVTAAYVASGTGARSPEPVAGDPPRTPPSRGGGYAVTEHVKRYYRTARV